MSKKLNLPPPIKIQYAVSSSPKDHGWGDDDVPLPPKPFSDVRKTPIIKDENGNETTYRRERNKEFMALGLVDRAIHIRKYQGMKCHTFMNFIPDTFMEQIDMDDEDEVNRCNIIFHYQRHPHHRPKETVQVEMTMKEQTVLTRKYARHGVLILGIDTRGTEITGYYLTGTGRKIKVKLMDFTDGVWQTM